MAKIMNRIYKSIFLAGIYGFVVLQPAFGITTPAEVREPAANTYIDLLTTISKAFEYMNGGDFAHAEPVLQKAIENPGFVQLDNEIQLAVLSASGYAARELKEWPEAHASFTRASEMPQATGEDWRGRMWAAYMLDDSTDAVFSLTTIANSWPDTLAVFSDRFVFHIAYEADKLPDHNLSFNLLNALYNRNFEVGDGREPGFLWRRLAMALIDRNQLERATEVASRVHSARELILMQADARFYSVLETDPARFDVIKGLSSEIAQLRSTAGKEPSKLEHMVELQYLLLAARQYDEVVRIADTAIAAISNGKKDQPAFDDIDDRLPWIMDNRAQALVRLGRPDDAINQFTEAARMNEHGEKNVSQAINLAELLMALNRADEALAAISKVGDASPFGQMQLQYVKFVTAYQKKDTKSADAAMSYLQGHQKDAVSAYSDALLIADRLDEAAQLLIKRLEDEDTRPLTLLNLQEFALHTYETPLEKLLRERFETIKSRPDVQEALGKIGRIKKYDIDRPAT